MALWEPVATFVGHRSAFECYNHWGFMAATRPGDEAYLPPPARQWGSREDPSAAGQGLSSEEPAPGTPKRNTHREPIVGADRCHPELGPDPALHWPRRPEHGTQPGDRGVGKGKVRGTKAIGKLSAALHYLHQGRDSEAFLKRERWLGAEDPLCEEWSTQSQKRIDTKPRIKIRIPAVK